jgi:magnesium transporter
VLNSLTYRKIALGTAILLAGVLALSWRLSNAETVQTPAAQSALAPGLGFVDDTSSEDDGDGSTTADEEEEAIGDPERQALLDPLTPTKRNNVLLGATKVRRRGLAEQEEIWGELDDEDHPFPSPSLRPRTRSGTIRSMSGRFNQDLSSGARLSSELAGDPNERTGLLRRADTVHSYRSSRSERRKSSALRRRATSPLSQAALGGWWKMKWWGSKKRKSKRKSIGADAAGDGAGESYHDNDEGDASHPDDPPPGGPGHGVEI